MLPLDLGAPLADFLEVLPASVVLRPLGDEPGQSVLLQTQRVGLLRHGVSGPGQLLDGQFHVMLADVLHLGQVM